MKRIFISSVQKEFESERAAIKRMIESDPILKPYFKVFVFEIDAPASDKSTQQVYAIAHRNYASIGSIQVEVYSDRVEVISPGRIHRAITVAELYKKHESFATNPRIARAMYQVKYIETIGTGLTDLLKKCKEKGLRKPLFEETSGRFRIVIWRPKSTANMVGNLAEGSQKTPQKGSLKSSLKSSLKILRILAAEPTCTYEGLAERIGISRRAITKQIKNLRETGKLKRIGPDKGGHWEVIEKLES